MPVNYKYSYDEEILFDFAARKPNEPISVIIPSYNHGKYIVDALESLADQTLQSFNVYVIDDSSTDNSIAVISHFVKEHPNLAITLIRHKRNEGAVQTLNELISISPCKYVALLNSDDVWLPNKLQEQYDFIDSHDNVGAVFTQANIVYEITKSFTAIEKINTNVFLQENRSRGNWLRTFFFTGNCLCHPSLMIRKSVYGLVGNYDIRYNQLPDLEMWIRLLKSTQIHIIEKPLVLLRWHNENTSSLNLNSFICNLNEMSSIYYDFFDSISLDLFNDGFERLQYEREVISDIEFECKKAFQYLKVEGALKSIAFQVGLHKLYRLIGNPEGRDVLLRKYNFTVNDFVKLRKSMLIDESLMHTFFTLEKKIGVTHFKQVQYYAKQLIKSLLELFPPLYDFTYRMWKNKKGRLHE